MSNGRRRRRSIFSGLVLILLGALFLYHNFYGGFAIWDLFARWWPLLLILWGLAKLYDHLAARGTGEVAPPTITGGEIFLVFLVFLLVGAIGGYEWLGKRGDMGDMRWPPWTTPYSFTEELPTKAVKPNAPISISTDFGNLTIHAEEKPEIRVIVKKVSGGGSEEEAQKVAQQVTVAATEAGEGYQVGTTNQGGRVQVDLEVHVPKQSSVTARTPRGDVQVGGVSGSVTAEAKRGDIDVRDIGGDVTAEVERGDVHIIGAHGNVKLSGRGGQVEVANVKGEAAVEGEFYGPIRIEKVAKGARFVSRRTDLSVSQLSGRIETGSGKLEITDAPGNVSLVTRRYDAALDNVAGRVHIENRDGNIELRYSQPPRELIEVSTTSGRIDLVVPGNSSFEIHAESRSGEIESDFEELTKQKKEAGGNTNLDAKLGSRGPQVRLKTTYGTIHLRKGQ